MQKSVEFRGKTTDDALAAGLKQLGLERDDVSVEIVERGKKGVFGIGAVDAVVRITYEGPGEEPEVPAPKPERKPAPAPKPAPKAEQPRPAPAPVKPAAPKPASAPAKPAAPKAPLPTYVQNKLTLGADISNSRRESRKLVYAS